jgi:hypothetical protein
MNASRLWLYGPGGLPDGAGGEAQALGPRQPAAPDTGGRICPAGTKHACPAEPDHHPQRCGTKDEPWHADLPVPVSSPIVTLCLQSSSAKGNLSNFYLEKV